MPRHGPPHHYGVGSTRKLLIAVTATGLAATIAAAPAKAKSAGHVLRGAGIGAVGGAGAGALISGLGVGTGALVGAAGGAAYNGLINRGHHHRYYRHSHRYHGQHY